MTDLDEQALLAIYRAHQARVWTANIIGGAESVLAAAGLHNRLDHPPAMCFLDITGYTRLTQERGDAAAADLASSLARLVERTSMRHGGRPVKWLGDGVMFFFPKPGPAVRGRPRDGGRRGRGRAAAGARRPARRAGDLPGRRLLRADGQRRRSDRGVRPAGRGAGQPGGRRRREPAPPSPSGRSGQWSSRASVARCACTSRPCRTERRGWPAAPATPRAITSAAPAIPRGRRANGSDFQHHGNRLERKWELLRRLGRVIAERQRPSHARTRDGPARLRGDLLSRASSAVPTARRCEFPPTHRQDAFDRPA